MDKRASIHGLVQGMFAASAAVLGGQAKHASEGSDPLEPKDDKGKDKDKPEGKEKDSCKVATEDAARTVQALRWVAEQIGMGKVAMGEEPGQVPNRPSPAIGNGAKDLGGKAKTPNFSDTPTHAEVPGSGSVGATTPQVPQDSPLKTAASTATAVRPASDSALRTALKSNVLRNALIGLGTAGVGAGIGAGIAAHGHNKNTDKDKKEDESTEGKTTTASLLAARPDLYAYALQKRAADQKDVPGGLTPRPTGENTEAIPAGVPVPKTNDAPSKLTAEQVHAQERKDLKTVFQEPAQTLSTDPVLSHAFAHKDGEKAASETVLSARGLLARLGAELDEESRRVV